MPNAHFDDQIIFQVAFVTPDIEKTKHWMADFFDMPVPETIVTGPLSETDAEYLGEPMPARCKLAFFKFGNTTLELLEPDHEPLLLARIFGQERPGLPPLRLQGEGHEGRRSPRSRRAATRSCRRASFPGGRYAYMDTEKNLGALIELLEFDKELAA